MLVVLTSGERHFTVPSGFKDVDKPEAVFVVHSDQLSLKIYS